MVKSISFIVLTHFFHFNELKILRQPGYLIKTNNIFCNTVNTVVLLNIFVKTTLYKNIYCWFNLNIYCWFNLLALKLEKLS